MGCSAPYRAHCQKATAASPGTSSQPDDGSLQSPKWQLLDNIQTVELVRLQMNRLAYAAYDPTLSALYVGYSWDPRCYGYSPVPKHLFDALTASPEPFAFYETYIRNSFPRSITRLDYVEREIENERQRRLEETAECEAQRAVRLADRQRRQKAEQNSREYWTSLSGWQFERSVAELFRSYGFEATVTRGSGDGGVDIRLRKASRTIVVQCKNHQKPVGPAVVRELFGTLTHEKADSAILVATGGYSPAAKRFASSNAILLLQLDDLVRIQARSHGEFLRFAESVAA